jgi:hypothetical protein
MLHVVAAVLYSLTYLYSLSVCDVEEPGMDDQRSIPGRCRGCFVSHNVRIDRALHLPCLVIVVTCLWCTFFGGVVLVKL